MSLSRDNSDASIYRQLQKSTRELKNWFKKKATSKPFQGTIAITEGVSLGSSTLSVAERLTQLASPSALGLNIAKYAGFSISGLVTIIMTYMTFKYVSINIKHLNQHGAQVKELQEISDHHQAEIKRLQLLMLIQKEQFIKTLDILCSENPEDDIKLKALESLKKELILDFKKLQDEAIERPRDDDNNQLNNPDCIINPITASSNNSDKIIRMDEPFLDSNSTSSPKSTLARHRFFDSSSVSSIQPEMIEMDEMGVAANKPIVIHPL